jgi:lysophospholipase L1-like esterase
MKKYIYWAGDSTVKDNKFTSYPQTGLGQGLRLFMKPEVEIVNHAENGRSTKSFIDEARLAHIYNALRRDDFLFIQFGHNDAKVEDPSRFTEAYGEYQENLERFVNVARNRNAYPVLITPLCRRWYDDEGTLKENIHGDYPAALKAVALKLGVPIVDLYEMSQTYLKEIGEVKSRRLFMQLPQGEYDNYPEGLDDNTHLTYDGAVLFARCIADGLKQLGGIYEELLGEY